MVTPGSLDAAGRMPASRRTKRSPTQAQASGRDAVPALDRSDDPAGMPASARRWLIRSRTARLASSISKPKATRAHSVHRIAAPNRPNSRVATVRRAGRRRTASAPRRRSRRRRGRPGTRRRRAASERRCSRSRRRPRRSRSASPAPASRPGDAVGLIGHAGEPGAEDVEQGRDARTAGRRGSAPPGRRGRCSRGSWGVIGSVMPPRQMHRADRQRQSRAALRPGRGPVRGPVRGRLGADAEPERR